MRSTVHTACLIALLLIAALRAFAQEDDLNLRFDYITVDDELSHSDVVEIVQDTLGYIWIGTNSGLNQYDGKDIRIFKHDFLNEYSLPDNRITELYIDRKGKLWIGTENGGLCWYNPMQDQFVQVPLPTHLPIRNNISAIYEDEIGRLWVGTKHDGVFMLSNVDQEDIYARHFFNQQGCANCVLSNEIADIYAPKDGEIWIGTSNGQFVINIDSGFVFSQIAGTHDITINCFMKKPDGGHLVGTEQGLYSLSSNYEFEAVAPETFSTFDIRDIFRDRENRMWVGTFNSGVFVLSPNGNIARFEQNQIDAGLSINYNRVNEIFEDSFGVLWIGTSGGGANYTSLDQLPFYHIFKEPNKSNQIISNYISAVHEPEPEYLWVGTRKGLSIIEKKSGKCKNFASSIGTKDIGDIISFILEDSQFRVWVLSRDRGLSLADATGLEANFKNLTDPKRGWPSDDYVGLAEDQYGRLWIATFNSGVVIYNPKTNEILQLTSGSTPESLPTNLLTYVYKDPLQNIMWLGSRDKGLVSVELIDEQNFTINNYKNDINDSKSLSWDYVWPIIADQNGAIWIGTIGGGLNKMIRNDNGKISFLRYDIRHGLPDNDVESIQVDDQGNLWIGGYGITRFSPDTQEFENFNVKDGLQSNAFKIGASGKSPSGVLYFGGINGLNYFHPDEITRHEVASHIVLTDLFLNNEKVEIGQMIDDEILIENSLTFTDFIRLPGHASDIRIDFNVINTAKSRNSQIQFGLEGYFDDWRNLARNQSSIDFPNLPPGTYHLKLKSVSDPASTEEAPTLLTIVKLPPWWRSNIAIGIYILLIVLSYILLRRFTVMQMSIRQNLALANKEQELSHSKIQFFTNISHELRTPLSLILGPLEDIIYRGLQPSQIRSSIQIMHKNAKRLMTLINMLLDFRKIESGQMNLMLVQEDISSFLKEIYLVFKAKAEEKHINFEFNVPEEQLPIFFDRLKMEIVFTNLLSNAFKFTRSNGTIEVRVEAKGEAGTDAVYDRNDELADNYVLIIIKDNGIGMSEEELKHIFDRFYQVRKLETLSVVGSGIGLSFSDDIIKLHKGVISVSSKEGKGSEFQIKMPVGKTHITKDHVIVETVHEYEKNEHYDLEGNTFFNDYIKGIDRQGKVSLLLIDDNPDVLQYLNDSLGQHYQVFTATNGKEGLDILEKEKIHLIVCDVMMPVMDGVEFTKRVKSSSTHSHIPLVLLTAKTAAVHEMEGLSAGADDYVSKPFSLRLLLTRLESLLNRQQKVQEYYKGLITLSGIDANVEEVDREFINRAIKVIDQNSEDEEFNVNSLADSLAMSRGALYKKIKENTDRSAVEFVREIKLSKAGRLLKTNNITINEVAINVGFRDIKYFRECFKKQFGITPSEFIKQTRAKN